MVFPPPITEPIKFVFSPTVIFALFFPIIELCSFTHDLSFLPYSNPAPTDEFPTETLKPLCLDFSLSCKLSRCKFATSIFTSLAIIFPPFIAKSCPLILIS
nr:hypothetical protein [Fusobacterium massiliense]